MRRTLLLVAAACVTLTACGGQGTAKPAPAGTGVASPSAVALNAAQLRQPVTAIFRNLQRGLKSPGLVPAQVITDLDNAAHRLGPLADEADLGAPETALHNVIASIRQLAAGVMTYPQFTFTGTNAQMPAPLRRDVVTYDQRLKTLEQVLGTVL